MSVFSKLLVSQSELFVAHWCKDKGGHTYSKLNVIVQLEIELAYYDSASHHFNHEDNPTSSVIIPSNIHFHSLTFHHK